MVAMGDKQRGAMGDTLAAKIHPMLDESEFDSVQPVSLGLSNMVGGECKQIVGKRT